ncbi:MAG: WecB/TagA/CpsF family glycosyltransferase [Acidisphaera sp.]|nr:WecB/TagA/CpsF family glycosyltransferase [Acidisphaera sp.]
MDGSAGHPEHAERVRFAGLAFDQVEVAEAVDRIAARSPDLPFAYVSTLNAEFVWLRRVHPSVDDVIEQAWLSTLDSRILRRIASWAGLAIVFTPGAYIVREMFLRGVIARDDRLTVLGGNPRALAILAERFGMRGFQQHVPPMGFINQPQAVQAAIDYVIANPARFVFIAMGPPHSDMLARMIAETGRAVGVGLCIGSSLDTLAGLTPPAPDWMERNGLVWLFRLAREPRRLWRRYLNRSLRGVGLALLEVLRRR